MNAIFDLYINCFRQYFVFSGRASRLEFLTFYVSNSIFGEILSLAPAIGWVFHLAIIAPGIAVSVRRLHDLNRSGWWFFISYSIILILGLAIGITHDGDEKTRQVIIIIILILLSAIYIWWSLFPGTKGPNRFGNETYRVQKSRKALGEAS